MSKATKLQNLKCSKIFAGAHRLEWGAHIRQCPLGVRSQEQQKVKHILFVPTLVHILQMIWIWAGASTKMCLWALILWRWRQPSPTRTDSTGQCQGIIRREISQFALLPGSLCPRWIYLSHRLLLGRSSGKNELKAENYLIRAETARWHKISQSNQHNCH